MSIVRSNESDWYRLTSNWETASEPQQSSCDRIAYPKDRERSEHAGGKAAHIGGRAKAYAGRIIID